MNTFQAFQDYAKNAREDGGNEEIAEPSQSHDLGSPVVDQLTGVNGRLQLAYNINVVLPETTNVEVYNAIFRSLKANLLS